MSEMITDLSDLLSPHHPSDLLQALTSNHRLHLHTDRASAFQTMLPWSKVSELVTLDRVVAGHTRVAINGHDLPLEMFTRFAGNRKLREIVPSLLQELASKGVSIVINGIDMAVPRIAALTAMLQRQLEVSAGVNGYVSFRKGGAFGAHWDGHNVLLLQLYGRKRWKTFGRQVVLPVKGALGAVEKSDLAEPEWEAVLEPGDILYLPRGEIHAATVVDEQSLHLTIEVSPAHGVNFARWIAERAADVETLRKDISTLPGSPPLDTQLAELRSALHDLIDSVDLEAFLAHHAAQKEPYKAANLGLDAQIDPKTWIKPTLRTCVALPPEGGMLEMGDVSVELSSSESAVLDAVLRRQAVRFADLADLVPNLSTDVVTECVGKLARKSLIFMLD